MRRRPLETADDREARQLPNDALHRLAELAEMQQTGEAETRPTIAQLEAQIKIWQAQIAAAR
jgi:hypothetical protein